MLRTINWRRRSWQKQRKRCRASSGPNASTSSSSCRARRPARCSASSCARWRVLKLDKVTKRFGERIVLNGVSLQLAAGDYVAIIGDSGIGKSTLLNVIAGLEPVDSGEVWFEDKNLTSLDDDALTHLRRDYFGFVFQAFHVLPQLDVQQNVELPLLLRKID